MKHPINLRLQGKRPTTIDGYSRAVRHNSNIVKKTVMACSQPKALYQSIFSVAASVLKEFAKK
ncbi:protein of unknown function [Moritella yayanosii]|uniref:Uncharacterized protein n=1 Tax=Moritella yayanosii TaxID=69539 RepID=A0A330LKP4_9GAMM|nr:hypothetical protein [Moritella yayanosii]SQD77594.1 protein of unknown function [Moritella yayanosii]